MRQPKPFYRKQTDSWYVQIGKKQVPLGKNEEKAWNKYHELMLDPASCQTLISTFAELCENYLDWLSANRADSTYQKSKYYLNDFAKFCGKSCRLDSFTARLVNLWVQRHPDWKNTTSNDAISIVQRVFNWGIKNQLIVRNPVASVPGKPRKERREVALNRSDWKRLRSLVDEDFGDYLDFLWETGCRPLEARMIEARHVDLKHNLVHFPPSESKGKKNDRIIYLTPKAALIIKKHLQRSGALFVNSLGLPWTKDAIKNRFQRLEQKFGRRICAYAIRHAYATEGLKAGFDSLVLAQLMGHQDATMIARTYSHLARNPHFLLDQAKRIRATDIDSE